MTAERSLSMRTRKICIHLTLSLVLVTLALSATAAAQLVPYDDFSSTRIDPAKWIGVPASVTVEGDVDRREVSVGLLGQGASRGLHISQTMYSSTGTNTGAGGSGFGLGFAHASKLTAVSFSLTVKDAQPLGCDDNGAAAFVVAGLSATFFNPNPSPDGSTGDITVGLSAIRFSTDSGNNVDISGGIAQCNDRKCINQTNLSFADLGPVPIGSTNTLAVTWDKPNHQFIFQLNANTPVASGYTLSDAYPPGVDLKSLFVFGAVPHCTATPRPYASMDTLFDNVFVNP